MSVIWHKVWFDLWHNKLRTLLVVISIAVGVFAVGATFGMVEQMMPTMDSAHQQTRPSPVTIFLTRPIDRDTILALAKLPGVEGIEPLNIIDMRYKIEPGDKWRKGSILVRDNYEQQTYDLLQLKDGEWPSGFSVAIERMHSPFYGLDIGDSVIFEVGDQEKTLQITGKIRHPFVPPPSMYDWAWFFGSAELMELYGIPAGQFTQIKVGILNYTPDFARVVASTIKDRLARQGIQVAATQYQDPAKHWGRAFLDGMNLVLQVVAVISMLLSAVLVLNTLTAIITQQTNQIGVLKAIGGSRSAIVQLYLVGVFIYGLLALGIALPLGAVASYQISRSFLGLFNIDYEQYAPTSQAIAFQILAALAVPLIAALAPVLNGAAISVRQAISSYGLGGDFGSSWLDRLVERIGRRFLAPHQAIALANTFRRKGRLLLTELVLVIAGVLFLMVMSLSSSLTATLDAEFGRRSHDIVVSFDELRRVDRTTALAETVAGVEKAEMWIVAPVTILHQGQRALDAGMGSQLQGVPVDDPMYTPRIVQGRWLQPGDGKVVVMNKETAADEQIRLGDTISLDMGEWGKEDWQVVGFYQVSLVLGGGYYMDALYAPRPAVYEATKKTGKGSTLLVRTTRHSEKDVWQAASDLEDLFARRHIDIYQIETMPALRKTSDAGFFIVVYMLLVLAVIVALVGGIGLMGSLWINVIERTKEIGILRAIGAVSSKIMGMFMLEGVLQGVMSWMIAIPISLALTPLMANALGQIMFQSSLDYRFNWSAVFIWLVIVLALSILASIIPAHNATRVNVRQSLNYE
jgi:putative ABC transport system permease protein